MLMLLFSGMMKLVEPPSVVRGSRISAMTTVWRLHRAWSNCSPPSCTSFPAPPSRRHSVDRLLGRCDSYHLRIGEPFHMPVLLGLLLWGGLLSEKSVCVC